MYALGLVVASAVGFSIALSRDGLYHAELIDQHQVLALRGYIRIDTSNPPGNEMLGARFWKELFDAEGIENEILAPSPGAKRASFVARLPGRWGRPLVLLNHLDVVPADPKRWRHPPFSGEAADGALWGRGATDMKGIAVVQAMVLVDLKRRGVVPERDVVFLATGQHEDLNP